MSVGRFLQQGAAGNAGEAVYVDDVFSTYLYDGNQSTQTITNGIDLDGEGGMVWLKARNSAQHNLVIDTVRGGENRLITNDTVAAGTDTGYHISSFNSDGFSLQGNGTGSNNSSYDYVSWTFRKQPGFFDVVTWTGDGTSNRNISHNLGSVPGCIMIKNLSINAAWVVYHRSLPSATYYLELNSTAAQAFDGDQFSGTAPTDSVFTVGPNSGVNRNGDSFIAYLFAHDAQDFGTDSDESIIKCGTFTGNPVTVDLGWEPQWILLKKTTGSNNWFLYDTMRGWQASGTGSYLQADATAAEIFTSLEITKINSTGVEFVSYGGTWVYVAIRRPHKPASEFAATDLFNTIARSGNNTTTQVPVGFSVDMFLSSTRSNAWYTGVTFDRLRGKSKFVETSNSNAEVTNTNQFTSFDQDGITVGADGSGWINNATPTYVYHLLKRAPGFFDVVAYTGTGSNMTVSHNLNATPELMIIKRREVSANWIVYHKDLGNTSYLQLEQNMVAATGQTTMFNSTSPTDSVFSLGTNGNVNASSSGAAIAYLFATVPGISKVGSYTSTGSDLDIDCGFTNGARFVLIKRNHNSSDWHLFDTERGIVAGNDPFLELNTTNAEDSANDAIDPISSGFKVVGGSICNQLLFGAGSTYIFLAIA